MRICFRLYAILFLTAEAFYAEPRMVNVDVGVYAATPSGILGAGLKPTQDCPNSNAVGGMARELAPSLGSDVLPAFEAPNARTISPKRFATIFQKLFG